MRNLASLGSLYPQVEELALRLLLDPEAEVVEKAFTELLPGFLAWAKAGDRLMAKLLPTVLARALSTVQVSCAGFVFRTSSSLQQKTRVEAPLYETLPPRTSAH